MAAANAARFRDLKARVLRDALPIRESPAMRALCALATRYARTGAPVLVSGESGTGKDMLASLVHGLSQRAAAPFVKINCGAIPKDLADSELFGHARGAFTGADRDYEGRMAPADGGTLFLDEVGELPAGVQVKLLRFLETGEFQRPGDSRPRRIDARVIAATNRDLAAAARSGDFREDLYFRLNVLPLAVPPLRERPDDVLPLARWFIDAAAARDGSRPPSLSDGAVRALLSYPFPGNARELRNVIERIVCVADSGIVDEGAVMTALGDRGQGGRLPDGPSSPSPLATLLSSPMSLAAAKDALELEYIRSILSMNGGSIKDTATALGVLPNNLSRRIKQLEAGT
jgi:transcriptional regulator with GAF, ATPase, and Fis domain